MAEKMEDIMFYVFTVDIGFQMVIKMTLGSAPTNVLLFEYANMPALAGNGSNTDISLGHLADLKGNWALIIPLDVLPHLQKLSAWEHCELVAHLADAMQAVNDATAYLKTHPG
jgi:hypothetical protein